VILIDQLGPGGRDPNFPLSRAELRSLCGRLLDGLGLSGREFELTLTRDGDMAEINADFSGIFAPTNVLSFPAHEVLGDGEGGLPGCALSGPFAGQVPGGFPAGDLEALARDYPEDGCCVDEEDFRPDDGEDDGDDGDDGDEAGEERQDPDAGEEGAPLDGDALALSGDADPAFLGSLVLSVDTLAREAFLYGQDPAAHLARLLAHGLLHLAGVPHGAEMEERTEAALIQAFFPEEGDSGDSPSLDGGTP
jgi:probable rRNA maturation factor